MPGLNGMGPYGLGAMTGRGRGNCIGYRRGGYGPGFGRHFAWRFHHLPWREADISGEEEVNYLKEVAKELKYEMETLQKRIEELTGKEN